MPPMLCLLYLHKVVAICPEHMHVSDDANISYRLFQPFEVEGEEGEEPIYKHKLTTSTWTDFRAVS